MRFRHPSGLRLALTSGHVTTIGTQWQALLPVFHDQALARGCQMEPARRLSPAVAGESTPIKGVEVPVSAVEVVKAAPAKKRPAAAKVAAVAV